MNKKESVSLRKKVRHLAKKGFKKSVIAHTLGVSRKFVGRWCEGADHTIDSDKRGWEAGKKRKYTAAEEKAVSDKRKELEAKFFSERRRFGKNWEKASQLLSSTGRSKQKA